VKAAGKKKKERQKNKNDKESLSRDNLVQVKKRGTLKKKTKKTRPLTGKIKSPGREGGANQRVGEARSG